MNEENFLKKWGMNRFKLIKSIRFKMFKYEIRFEILKKQL